MDNDEFGGVTVDGTDSVEMLTVGTAGSVQT